MKYVLRQKNEEKEKIKIRMTLLTNGTCIINLTKSNSDDWLLKSKASNAI